jgi:hypothetical protein
MDKIFVGSGKGKFENNLVEITVCLTDLPKEFIFEYKDKKYIKLKVQKKKETDKFGKTHSVEVDTFKPNQEPKKAEQNEYFNDEPGDLPF